ncbi:M81 family metallopeptidase [Dyadobacter sp. LHD-138]|uniref:M81 family metallopeptidase n=1 Tax=Dyadobacter sp. LHD-138 TaxID=3071413 RepID=UPI0027E04A59|nr:M81 family metallopeptidase [Dyadobacter sp. LHD-138]MDQ6481000.1 M81 family metallopeptidase [Dyadobacter sp. LHD-138]
MSVKSTNAKRVALLGIYHETNTFINLPTTLDDFKSGYWLEGEAIRAGFEGGHHEISGIIEVLDGCSDMELVPVLYASATPGGLIEKASYEYIVQAMMEALDQAGVVDGCIVVPHGAGVAAGYPDMDGHWLSLLREKMGSSIPMIGTLDPHANVSEAMTSATNALVAYATNPHIDQKETGRKAAGWMVETLRGNIRPVQQLVQLPLAISIEQQYTSQDPCRSLYVHADNVRLDNNLLSVSVILGFPYADVVEMGSAFIIVSDGRVNDNAIAINKACADELAGFILAGKEDFSGEKVSIGSVMSTLASLPKPVLMLDMGDNVGGGAPGNSTFLLEALEEETASQAFICIHDPQAVLQSAKYKADDFFELSIAGVDKICRVGAELLQLVDGKFTENTPKHGGFSGYDMGPTAIVKTLKGNVIMLTTHRTPPYSLGQLTGFGLDPGSFGVIVAKGVNAPIAAYKEVCPSIVQVDTPGVTQADMTLFTYHNRRKPMFPFESGDL